MRSIAETRGSLARNGKQVGSFADLTPTPHSSGESERELGIGKDGSRHIRAMAVELAWAWLRFQPQTDLRLH